MTSGDRQATTKRNLVAVARRLAELGPDVPWTDEDRAAVQRALKDAADGVPAFERAIDDGRWAGAADLRTWIAAFEREA